MERGDEAVTKDHATTLVARSLDRDEISVAIADFWRDGVARIPQLLVPSSAHSLARRVEQVMDGALDPGRFFFQHDAPTGRYRDLPLRAGWIGPSRNYRKIEQLQRDELFREWLDHPALEPIVGAVIAGPISLYRAVAWNKAPGGGTELPWHQDAGPFWGLDREPVLQLWTALDDVPPLSGCLEVVVGSHRGGLATPQGGTIPDSMVATIAGDAKPIAAQRGDLLLLHNLLWHRSGRNHTTQPRRALSACYLSAETRCTRKRGVPRQFERRFERI
jgi:phytanoyl-CoA hydroxylase